MEGDAESLSKLVAPIRGAYMDLSRVSSPVAPSHVAAQLASDEVFKAIRDGIEANKAKAQAVKGVFLWNITKGGKQEAQWVMDLKKGSLYAGDPESGTKVDTTLTIEDQDMVDMSVGKLNPQTAFMKGKLKIKGNIMLTQKLKNVLPSDSKL